MHEFRANEAEELREALQRTVQPAEPPSTPKKQRGCREALAVMNRVSASPLARARLTLHQRIILATILDLSNTGGHQHVDRNRIYGEYAKVYAKLNLAEPTIGEVVDTISALVSNSMIAVPQKPKNAISMLVDPDTGRVTSQIPRWTLYFSEGSDLTWRLRQHDPLSVRDGLETSSYSVPQH